MNAARAIVDGALTAYVPDPGETTSLSKLDERDWNVLRNTWARGGYPWVRRLGRKWIIDHPDHLFDGFGLLKTRKAASEAVDNLICWEARCRAARRAS